MPVSQQIAQPQYGQYPLGVPASCMPTTQPPTIVQYQTQPFGVPAMSSQFHPVSHLQIAADQIAQMLISAGLLDKAFECEEDLLKGIADVVNACTKLQQDVKKKDDELTVEREKVAALLEALRITIQWADKAHAGLERIREAATNVESLVKLIAKHKEVCTSVYKAAPELAQGFKEILNKAVEKGQFGKGKAGEAPPPPSTIAP